mmetsp:Transcript_6579/g.14365  ORF Transcript_6579/g.14365 Transcript_6579/m.14365 type:complete len:90 (-) Transcript_6579:18-287(-)
MMIFGGVFASAIICDTNERRRWTIGTDSSARIPNDSLSHCSEASPAFPVERAAVPQDMWALNRIGIAPDGAGAHAEVSARSDSIVRRRM